MAGIPINFALPGEGSVASYNWTEIASGLGYRSFNFAALYDGSAENYVLVENNLFTEGVIQSSRSGGVTTTEEKDFDLIFNKPFQLAPGNVYTTCALGTQNSTAGTLTITGYLELTLYKVVGVTETTIGTTRSQATGASTNSAAANWLSVEYIFPIASQVNFAKGDKLRVTARIVLTSTANNTAIAFFFDPSNLGITTYGYAFTNTRSYVNSKIYVPQRIDL